MESDLQAKRLSELAQRASRTGRVQYTRFVDPALVAAAEGAAARSGVSVRLWGGHPEAERVMAGFYDIEPPEDGDFPLCALQLDWNDRFSRPEHRDLLGAVMGLGLQREATGDILMGRDGEKRCGVLFATDEMADYIAANLESAGRTTLRARRVEVLPEIALPEGRELRITVQQPRLDAVLSAGFDLSRAQAQHLVMAGLVKLNHLVNTRTDAHLRPGDLISARGYGRLRVLREEGQSRRGRQVLVLFKYGKQ